MTDNGKVLLALLGGAVVGVTIGLLFAPEKGEEIRQKIVDATQDFSNKVMGKTDDLAENAEGTFEKGKSKVKQQF